MKVLVAVKRVMDYKAIVRIKADGSGVETSNVKMSMNPFDEIAVEEAIRLKEKGIATEIIAVSIGDDTSQETLRTALAMGADRAILIKTNQAIQPLAAANILSVIAKKEAVQFILLGKQAIDTDNNQTGQMLAGLLNWGQGTFASELAFHDEGVSVTREIDGGLETVFLSLPAVVTTDLRLNEPRYLSLPNIVQAKKKTIDIVPVDTLNVDISSHIKVLSVAQPKKQRAGKRLETAVELVDRLRHEAQVIE
jgi:electron transfer flavoprotein beta subunit